MSHSILQLMVWLEGAGSNDAINRRDFAHIRYVGCWLEKLPQQVLEFLEGRK